jgi:DNA-binding NarL/FixJ family response regulator
MQTIRIVIADDHPIFRDGLRRLLEAEPGFNVVGEAGSGRDALKLLSTLTPEILLLDLAMPDGAGLDVLRALNANGAIDTVRVVLLTAAAEKREMIEALQLGARGLVLKHSATSILHKCIRAVVAGEYWFGHDRLPDMIDALRQLREPQVASPAQTLTRREIHVIAAVVSGATNRDISEQLGVSEQTIKNHLSHIYDKVGVSNRLELALFAIHHNLLADYPGPART